MEESTMEKPTELDLDLDIERGPGRQLPQESVTADLLLMKGVAAKEEASLVRLWEVLEPAAQAVATRKASAWNLWELCGRTFTEDLIVDAVLQAFEDVVNDAEWWNPEKGWSLRTYYCTRAVQALERLAKQQLRRQQIPYRMQEKGVQPPRVSDDPMQLAIQNIAQEELAEEVRRAIQTLSQTLQRSLILRFNRDMSIAEIADELEITTDAAKKRLSRARIEIATELTKRGLRPYQ